MTVYGRMIFVVRSHTVTIRKEKKYILPVLLYVWHIQRAELTVRNTEIVSAAGEYSIATRC